MTIPTPTNIDEILRAVAQAGFDGRTAGSSMNSNDENIRIQQQFYCDAIARGKAALESAVRGCVVDSKIGLPSKDGYSMAQVRAYNEAIQATHKALDSLFNKGEKT